ATLFQAFGRLALARPQTRLVVIGEGMDASDARLAQLAKESGAPDRVHFLGLQFDLERLLPAFDVAVSSPRMSEGFQNCLVQSVACAVPVVATNIGEATGIVGDTQRIVPCASPHAFAAAI